MLHLRVFGPPRLAPYRRLMIFVVVKEVQASDSVQFYVDQVQKKQGRDLSPLAGDLPRFLGKGKKSIDLESVVITALLLDNKKCLDF